MFAVSTVSPRRHTLQVRAHGHEIFRGESVCERQNLTHAGRPCLIWMPHQASAA